MRGYPSPMADQIRTLLIHHGLKPDEADACLSITVREIIESTKSKDEHYSRVSICHRIAHHLTSLQLGRNTAKEEIRRKFEHNYLIISGALAAGVFEGFKILAESVYGITSSVIVKATSKAPQRIQEPSTDNDSVPILKKGDWFWIKWATVARRIGPDLSSDLTVETSLGLEITTIRAGARFMFVKYLKYDSGNDSHLVVINCNTEDARTAAEIDLYPYPTFYAVVRAVDLVEFGRRYYSGSKSI